ncbi:MAG TPA: biopolymer transporter ExbD [Pyrinomonadaceae bacterium]
MSDDVKRSARSACAPHINVTPMIDILLVLLILFMVLTPLRPSRFKTLVPEPAPVGNMSPRTLVVSIDESLRVKLIRGREEIAEGSVADAGAVAARLAAEWRARVASGSWRLDAEHRRDLAPEARIERTVFVRAPRSVAYGDVAKVIDGVKGAGAEPVGLQTDELP